MNSAATELIQLCEGIAATLDAAKDALGVETVDFRMAGGGDELVPPGIIVFLDMPSAAPDVVGVQDVNPLKFEVSIIAISEKAADSKTTFIQALDTLQSARAILKMAFPSVRLRRSNPIEIIDLSPNICRAFLHYDVEKRF